MHDRFLSTNVLLYRSWIIELKSGSSILAYDIRFQPMYQFMNNDIFYHSNRSFYFTRLTIKPYFSHCKYGCFVSLEL